MKTIMEMDESEFAFFAFMMTMAFIFVQTTFFPKKKS